MKRIGCGFEFFHDYIYYEIFQNFSRNNEYKIINFTRL